MDSWHSGVTMNQLPNTARLKIMSICAALRPVSIHRRPGEIAAALCASACAGLWNNPVKSLESRKLYGIVAKEYFDWTQQNALLYSGMSTLTVADDGSVYISRPISMYQERANGTPDDAYLDINTAEAMDRIRELISTEASKRFVGTTAAKSSEGFGPTVKITTEDSVKAFLLSLMRNRLIYGLGWCQEYEYYKSARCVTRLYKPIQVQLLG